MVNFLDRLVRAIKGDEELEEHRDLVGYSRAGIPINVLELGRIPRGIIPPVLDREPPRKRDYTGAPNRIGDSQIFHLRDYSLEEEEQ